MTAAVVINAPPSLPLPPLPLPSSPALAKGSPRSSSAHRERIHRTRAPTAASEDDSDDSLLDPIEVRRHVKSSPDRKTTTRVKVEPVTPPLGSPITHDDLARIISRSSSMVTLSAANLSSWATVPTRPSQLRSTPYANLPAVKVTASSISSDNSGASTTIVTSQPISNLTPLQHSLSQSLQRLLSVPVFAAYLQTPTGYAAFHHYLTTISPSPRGAASLELWRDLRVLQDSMTRAGGVARGIRDVYLVPGGSKNVEVPSVVLQGAVGSLPSVIDASNGLEMPAKHLLESLHRNQFQEFVKYRLLRHTSVQLGKYNLTAKDKKGLGEAFVMSDPRAPDQPIVLVSPAFCALTGYPAHAIIGRNCRFLQGEATSKSSVTNIKQAISNGEDVTQLILNYRSDGTPFWNLLCIIALRNESGDITYFVGGQTSIAGTISKGSGADLSFILGDGDVLDEESASRLDPTAHSPEVDEYKDRNPLDDEISTPTPATPESPRRNSLRKKSPPSGSPSSPAPTPFTKKLNGIFKRKPSSLIVTKPPPRSPTSSPPPSPANPARLLNPNATSIEDRVSEFTSTYERVVVFKRDTREIIFLTSSFLRFCGLQGSSLRDVYASSLLHTDVLKLIGGEPSEKKDSRSRIKDVVKKGESLSMPCSIQQKEKNEYGRMAKSPAVRGVLHLTPLKDLEDAVAYVGVFAATL